MSVRLRFLGHAYPCLYVIPAPFNYPVCPAPAGETLPKNKPPPHSHGEGWVFTLKQKIQESVTRLLNLFLIFRSSAFPWTCLAAGLRVCVLCHCDMTPKGCASITYSFSSF